jgi:hypothetical protein
MAIHYFSAYEEFTQKRFEMFVPAYFEPNMPKEFSTPIRGRLPRPQQFKPVPTRRRDPTPFYQPEDPDQKQKANYPVEMMVEMFTKKVQFELLRDEDTVPVMSVVDRYLVSLQTDLEMGHEGIIAYVRLILPFRAALYKHYYRYMYNNPAARDGLYIGNDSNNTLASMLAIIGGAPSNIPETDPIKAMSFPPVDPDAASKKVDVTSDAGMASMESSFGLSMANVVHTNNMSDFDLDAFLGRKPKP